MDRWDSTTYILLRPVDTKFTRDVDKVFRVVLWWDSLNLWGGPSTSGKLGVKMGEMANIHIIIPSY